MRLRDKVAIITGGGTGIGKGVAECIAREGAKVALVAIDTIDSASSHYKTRNIGGYTSARKVTRELQEKGYEAIAIEADITKEDQVENMISETVKKFGRVDIVVNCAGVISVKKIEDLTVDDWDTIMDVNAKGTFLVNKAAAAQMRKQGGGKIINFSSDSGKKGEAELTHYCASKWAVVGFTKALSKELARENITVNAICPGMVGTKMWKTLSKDLAQQGESEEGSYRRIIESCIPQGVPQTPEDMAKAVIFLAVSNHITGEALSVDGGSAT